MSIYKLSLDQMAYLIENYQNPLVRDNLVGKYLATTDGVVIAVDNEQGEAYAEEFKTIGQAIRWLNNEFEIEDYLNGRIDSIGCFK